MTSCKSATAAPRSAAWPPPRAATARRRGTGRPGREPGHARCRPPPAHRAARSTPVRSHPRPGPPTAPSASATPHPGPAGAGYLPAQPPSIFPSRFSILMSTDVTPPPLAPRLTGSVERLLKPRNPAPHRLCEATTPVPEVHGRIVQQCIGTRATRDRSCPVAQSAAGTRLSAARLAAGGLPCPSVAASCPARRWGAPPEEYPMLDSTPFVLAGRSREVMRADLRVGCPAGGPPMCAPRPRSAPRPPSGSVRARGCSR